MLRKEATYYKWRAKTDALKIKEFRKEAKGQETYVGWKVIENGGQKQHEENEVGEMTMGMKGRTRSKNNRQSEFGDVRGPIRKAREDCRGGCRLVSSLPWMIKKNPKRYGVVEGCTDRDKWRKFVQNR